jgi:putative chitinase
MILKKGSTGADVKKLQERLKIPATGIFCDNTEIAVKRWQKENGLKDDGIAGPITQNKLGMNESIQSSAGSFNIERLKGQIPDNVLSQLTEVIKKFNIINASRLSHFLGQCAHESGQFKVLVENLNYSASGLKKVFPNYFPGSLNESYANKPEEIGSRVYASRMGNGDERSREGFRFRGRGYIQLTGKANYEKFSKFIGEDVVSNPDLVSTKYPLASAAFFFNSNNLWSLCDRGIDDNAITNVTKRVNGGTHGLTDRIQKTKLYHHLLTR